MFRLLALGALLSAFLVPTISRAAPAAALSQKDGPTFIVRVQSITQLFNHAEYLAGLAGQEETAKQMLGFIRPMIGEKGLEGVDVKQPFVVFGYLNQELVNSDVVVMIPIADKDVFLGLLKNRLSLEIKDEKDGLYSFDAPNNVGAAYFRFANGYVYATYRKKENLVEAKLPKPADLVSGNNSVVSIGVRVDRLPEDVKKFMLGAVENLLASGKEQPIPIETPKIKELRDRTIDSVSAGLKAVLFECEEITLNINVDGKKDELGLEFNMTPKKDSQLAKDFADLKARKSVAFGSLAAGDTAMMMAFNVSAPTSIKKVLGPAVDDLVKMGLDMIPNDAQNILAPLVKAVTPTLKSGDLDGGAAFIGPNADGKYTALVVGKITDGKEIEKAVKDIAAQAPEPFKSNIELDADSVGATKLHLIKIKDQLDADAKKLFGESDLWLAFRDDAVLIAVGPNAKEVLKKAVTGAPAPASLLKMDFFVSRLMSLSESQDPKATKQAVKKVFGDNPKSDDTFTLQVEGGDKLSVKLAVKGKIVKFFAELDKAKKGIKD
jgi:hypothetical protein